MDDLSPWKEVMTIPSGEDVGHLGLSNCYHCEMIAPKTFLVDRTGSIWIADSAKARIVRFEPSGHLPGQVLFAGAEAVRRLEPLDGGVVALFDDGKMVQLDRSLEVVERGVARPGGKAVYLYDLYQAEGRIFAFSFGSDVGGGLSGSAELLDVSDGRLKPVPGLPLSDSTFGWIKLVGHGSNTAYELLTTRADGARAIRRFEISWAEPQKLARADVELLGIGPVGMVVTVQPLAPPWYSPRNVGTWLLALDPAGEVVASAHVDPVEMATSNMTMGEGGDIYRMRLHDEGVVIERLNEPGW